MSPDERLKGNEPLMSGITVYISRLWRWSSVDPVLMMMVALAGDDRVDGAGSDDRVRAGQVGQGDYQAGPGLHKGYRGFRPQEWRGG